VRSAWIRSVASSPPNKINPDPEITSSADTARWLVAAATVAVESGTTNSVVGIPDRGGGGAMRSVDEAVGQQATVTATPTDRRRCHSRSIRTTECKRYANRQTSTSSIYTHIHTDHPPCTSRTGPRIAADKSCRLHVDIISGLSYPLASHSSIKNAITGHCHPQVSISHYYPHDDVLWCRKTSVRLYSTL